MCDKLWEHLQRLGLPPHLQQVVKVMYTTFYTNIQINGDTHGEIVPIIVVKQWCLLSPPHYLACTLMNLKHISTRSMRILHGYLT